MMSKLLDTLSGSQYSKTIDDFNISDFYDTKREFYDMSDIWNVTDYIIDSRFIINLSHRKFESIKN